MRVMLGLGAILFLLLVKAFFVAAEFALVRSKRARLEAMTRGGDSRARLAHRAMGELARTLSACQLGITLSSLALGWVAASVVIAPLAARLPPAVEGSLRLVLAAMVALLAISYVHVVFAELAPRALALAHPERVARWLAPPLIAFTWLARPLLVLIDRTAGVVLRRSGVQQPWGEEPIRSPDDLRLLVEQSDERGGLAPLDADLLEGVFEFSEKTAREVMTPRTEIAAIPLEATLDETVAIVEENRRSRYPVYTDTIDDIVGLVLAKDLLPVLHRPPADFSLRTLVRPVHIIPGAREVEDVLADFKRLKEHMAVVVDEYGGTAGLVTMEDLLEEIVGEILDEYDEPVHATRRGSGGEVLVPGLTNIGELNERFGLALPDEQHTTIGGFVFTSLGRLPVGGDRVTAGGAVLTVVAMDGRRIDTVAIDLRAAGDRRAAERGGVEAG